MAIIHLSSRYPLLPPAEGMQIEDSVDSDEAIGLTEAVNHALFWRGRRAVHVIYQHDASSTPITEQDPSVAGGLIPPIWWKTSIIDKYVWVSVQYQASPAATAGLISISAELTTKAGAALDDPAGGPGIEWTYLDGTLPAERVLLEVEPIFGIPRYRYPVLRVDTSDLVDDAPAGSYPTKPRPLNLGAAGADEWVRLDLRTNQCRILAVDVWTLFNRTVEV